MEKFKGRMNAEVRRQEKLDIAKERDFRRQELLKKYIAKILYGWKFIKDFISIARLLYDLVKK